MERRLPEAYLPKHFDLSSKKSNNCFCEYVYSLPKVPQWEFKVLECQICRFDWSLVLLPNTFAIFFGVAGFPFTCAPMFAHHVNKDTQLCVFKFEGSNACKTVDLGGKYGKNKTMAHCQCIGRTNG